MDWASVKRETALLVTTFVSKHFVVQHFYSNVMEERQLGKESISVGTPSLL
jgi:hypothetical protein